MQYQERFQDNIASTCGLGEEKALLLVGAGYGRLCDLRAASNEELLALEGIEVSDVRSIRNAIGGD